MNNLTRLTIAIAVLGSLAACGNKGPLVRPAKISSDIPAPAAPTSMDPTIALPAQEPLPPADTGAGGTTTPPAPEPLPAPPADGGNG